MTRPKGRGRIVPKTEITKVDITSYGHIPLDIRIFCNEKVLSSTKIGTLHGQFHRQLAESTLHATPLQKVVRKTILFRGTVKIVTLNHSAKPAITNHNLTTQLTRIGLCGLVS